MTTRLAIFPLIAAAWSGAARVILPAAPWLILFALAAGLYSWAINSAQQSYMIIALFVVAWAAGVAFSWRVYAVLLPNEPQMEINASNDSRSSLLGVFLGWFIFGYYLLFRILVGSIQWVLGARSSEDRRIAAKLAHANLAAYAAFLFIGFFVIFFLMMLPGILIEEAGQYQLSKESDPALAREAFMAMLGTPYGAVFLICCAAGAAVLGWFALRLTLYGAATVATGEAHVFRTWGLTKGHLKTLLPASLVTHILPFAAGVAINTLLHSALPDTAAGHFISGAVGVLVFAPFLLAGHGMAAAAWTGLKPAPAAQGDDTPDQGD